MSEYILRLYDKFDHEWIDVFGPDTKDKCQAEFNKNTSGGKKFTKYEDGHYYAIFPANTTMTFAVGWKGPD